MATKTKLKMSNKKFRVLHGIGIFFLLLFTLILVAVGTLAGSILDTNFGRGATSIVTPADKSDWDANYYETAYANNDESTEAAYKVAVQIQQEGTVLLKNDGALPLAAGSTVVPFGYGYTNPIYGQLTAGGSAKWVSDPVTPEQGLSAFTVDNSAVDAMAGAEVEATVEAAGTQAAGAAGSLLGGDCKIYEYDPAIYDGIKVADSTGIVFITRSGQEGQDQKFDAYEDGTPHYLALSANERGTIAAAKAACDQVVVVLVSSAPLEMGDLVDGELAVDAILWYGHPSERGFIALSDILTGAVNPSGRTVDTWAADFTADPSYSALGVHEYTNLTSTSGSLTDGGEINRTFNEYQEGVYMGYRYYETADLVDPDFDYDSAVVFPFGYGLSYTTFEQELVSLEETDGIVSATVKVTNTGDVAGKEAVELYFGAPYTELDAELGIEKPAANLIQYDKTALLEPGASQTLELSFATEDMASYSYAHDNGDGTLGCYVLEAGDYTVSLRVNSHDVIDEGTIKVAETIWFDGSDDDHIRQAEKDAQSTLDAEGNPTGETADGSAFVAATNKFQASSDYMNDQAQILSRSAWDTTQPDVPATREIDDVYAEDHDRFVTFDPETDPVYGNVEGSLVYAAEEPTSGADNGLVASDLRGLAYDDPKWDELLDQIDWDADREGIIRNFSGDAYETAAIDSIGLPGTIEADGANGLKVNGFGGYDVDLTASYPFAPTQAATWNKELMYEFGVALGQEALQSGVSGWYSPAINLHRSVFCGRVFEYYSEDPILTGMTAERIMSGAANQGMNSYLKHFALNDTETGRSKLICTWADEQTMRELYLKPFEIALRNARMTVNYLDGNGTAQSTVKSAGIAVMASQAGLGTQLGHTNYALLTELLRGEWGFEGVVISDYWTWNGDNHRDLCLRIGCDTYLNMNMPSMFSITDYDSATSRTAMRNAIHHLAYAVVNSNAMQGLVPGATVTVGISPWIFVLGALVIVNLLLIANAIRMMVKRGKDELEHPELYKRGKRAEAKLQKKLAKTA